MMGQIHLDEFGKFRRGEMVLAFDTKQRAGNRANGVDTTAAGGP